MLRVSLTAPAEANGPKTSPARSRLPRMTALGVRQRSEGAGAVSVREAGALPANRQSSWRRETLASLLAAMRKHYPSASYANMDSMPVTALRMRRLT